MAGDEEAGVIPFSRESSSHPKLLGVCAVGGQAVICSVLAPVCGGVAVKGGWVVVLLQ